MRESKLAQRERAIRRGLEFIYSIACDSDYFADYGSDLVSCFYFISATSQDSQLRTLARRMGRERARRWRQNNPALPKKVDADIIADFAHGSYAAARLGIRDEALKKEMQRAATRFSPQDYLWFDPSVEPPPTDVPEVCDCGWYNLRGRKTCRRCRRRLKWTSRYWVFMDALVKTYTGERYGVTIGASFASVIKWLPSMRPYDTHGQEDDDPEFYEKIYAITHVIYTLNDYSLYRLSPRWLSAEYEYLKAGLRRSLEVDDPEMLGEIMDSLRAFGMTSRHPLIREGIEYLMSRQNADGSWGDLETENIYQRYHPTWTAMDGLREYRWRGERLSFPKLRVLL
jgi:hypothetical protein